MTSTILWGVLLILASACARADLPPVPYAKASSSPDGTYVFVMAPKWSKIGLNSEVGLMYKVQPNGELTDMWRSKMPYSRNAFVADDGLRVALIYDQIFADTPPEEGVALEFYNAGVLYSRVKVMDIVDSKNHIRRTMSFYTWLEAPASKSVSLSGLRLTVVTVGGVVREFDFLTGLQVSPSDPSKPTKAR